MGINLKRNVFKRIVLVILVIITFNIMCPPQVEASTFLGAAGGAIIDTIFDFLVFLGDSVIDILQENFITPSPAIKPATAKEFSTFDMGHFGWLICGIIFAVVGITAIFTGGLSLPVIGGLLIPMAVGGLATTVIAGANLIEGLKGDFDIPTIVYTPYTIFSGQIPAFDINFINPGLDYDFEVIEEKTVIGFKLQWFREKDSKKYKYTADCRLKLGAGGSSWYVFSDGYKIQVVLDSNR